MKEINIPLKRDWMERSYFGTELAKLLDNKDNEDNALLLNNWASEGMQCCALKTFLDNQTGGLLLIAGPRGVGKTSLVRNALSVWENKRSENEKKKKKTFRIVDAADLGLFETLKNENYQLERVLILGLLRTIQDAMIPVANRATLWSAVIPSSDDEFFRDLVALIRVASSDSASMDYTHSDNQEGRVKGKGELGMKASFLNFFSANVAIEMEQAKKWIDSRSTQLNWSCNTDAIRAELRALFQRYKDRNWPLLVLDEWDRFEEQHSPQGLPNLEQVLTALGRIKSLLADYPAPVIIVGGEGIYKKVRRKRHRADDDLVNHDDSYTSIFHHQCFISPLPNITPNNPLLPYLNAITEGNDEIQLNEIADYLLFEIGPNPHKLKMYLSHYIRADDCNLTFKHYLTAEMKIKILMSQAIINTLQYWENNYSGIVPAGPYRRLFWFRFLRNRFLAYWESESSYVKSEFHLPALTEGSVIAVPRNVLLNLEEKEILQLNKKQIMDIDLQLSSAFFRCYQEEYHESHLEILSAGDSAKKIDDFQKKYAANPEKFTCLIIEKSSKDKACKWELVGYDNNNNLVTDNITGALKIELKKKNRDQAEINRLAMLKLKGYHPLPSLQENPTWEAWCDLKKGPIFLDINDINENYPLQNVRCYSLRLM